jgi:hypothetical protein
MERFQRLKKKRKPTDAANTQMRAGETSHTDGNRRDEDNAMESTKSFPTTKVEAAGGSEKGSLNDSKSHGRPEKQSVGDVAAVQSEGNVGLKTHPRENSNHADHARSGDRSSKGHTGRDEDVQHEALHWQARYESLSKDYQAVTKKRDDLENNLKTLSAQLQQFEHTHSQNLLKIEEARKEIERLAHTLKDRDEELGIATEKLRIANQDNDKLWQNWKATAAELSKHLSEASPLADDDFFIKAWGNLKYKVIDWSQNHFGGVLQPKSFALDYGQKPPPGERPFRCLSNNADRYLHSDDQRPCIVQSFIWSILMDKVFACPGREGSRTMDLTGLYWAGAQRDHLDSLRDFLYPGKTTTDRELMKLTRIYS